MKQRRFTTQPAADVSLADVLRVVNRDFSKDSVAKAIESLGKYKQIEADRVRLACLKLAQGNLRKLKRFIDEACDDYRDVIGPAEYPEDWSYMLIDRPKGRTERDSWKADWEQYESWLNG